MERFSSLYITVNVERFPVKLALLKHEKNRWINGGLQMAVEFNSIPLILSFIAVAKRIELKHEVQFLIKFTVAL